MKYVWEYYKEDSSLIGKWTFVPRNRSGLTQEPALKSKTIYD